MPRIPDNTRRISSLQRHACKPRKALVHIHELMQNIGATRCGREDVVEEERHLPVAARHPTTLDELHAGLGWSKHHQQKYGPVGFHYGRSYMCASRWRRLSHDDGMVETIALEPSYARSVVPCTR